MLTIQRGERSEHPSPPFSYPDFVDIRENNQSFSGMLGYHDDYISITGSAKPERVYGALTSADFFEVLGVQPYLGRTLISTKANERAGAAIVVLSYNLWQNQFAGDPGIIGKTIQLNLHPYTIVGVAPKNFRGCKSGLRTDIFLPLAADDPIWGSNRIGNRGVAWINVLGVLRQGVDPHQADNELNILMERITSQYPAEHRGANQVSTDPLWRSPFGANVYMAVRSQFCWRWPRYYCFLHAPMSPTCCWCDRWRGGANLRSAFRWAPGAGRWCASSWQRTFSSRRVGEQSPSAARRGRRRRSVRFCLPRRFHWLSTGNWIDE